MADLMASDGTLYRRRVRCAATLGGFICCREKNHRGPHSTGAPSGVIDAATGRKLMPAGGVVLQWRDAEHIGGPT